MRGVHVLTVTAALLALAACGDKTGDQKAAADKAGDAPATGAPATPGAAAATPKLRAGLWRVTTTEILASDRESAIILTTCCRAAILA